MEEKKEVIEKVKVEDVVEKKEPTSEILEEATKAKEEINNQFEAFIELFNWELILFYKEEIGLFLGIFFMLFFVKNFISNKILSKLDNTKNTISEVKKLTINFFYLSNFVFAHIILYFQGFPFEAFKFVEWILSIGYFIFGIIMINNLNKLFFRYLYKSKKYKLQKVEAHFMSKITSFFIYIIAFFFALSMLGINISLLIGSLGFIGFAISFAAKESIANFFGGIMVLLNKSFDHGDWIYISDKEEGTVVETHFLTTTIRTFDNSLIHIPNSRLSSSSIRNWSKRVVGRRIKLNIGVLYNTKIEDLENIVKDIRNYLENNPKIAKPTETQTSLVQSKDSEGIKETLLVNIDNFGASSIDIMVYCFSETVNWADWLDVKQEVMLEIIKIVRKNNSDFAFPTTTIDGDFLKQQSQKS